MVRSKVNRNENLSFEVDEAQKVWLMRVLLFLGMVGNGPIQDETDCDDLLIQFSNCIDVIGHYS